MPLILEKHTVEREFCAGFVCDKCGAEYSQDDTVEMQEKLYKHDVGGYGSLFGDGDGWSVTLCQKCWHGMIGKYIQYDEI